MTYKLRKIVLDLNLRLIRGPASILNGGYILFSRSEVSDANIGIITNLV